MEKLSRILLIDDDEITNYMNKRVLNKAEIAQHIDVVTDGQAALDYLASAEHANSSLPLDLILVDIKMSVMDGFDFLDQYQHLPEGKKAKKLFALSSSASFYDLHKLKEFPDVDGHLSKPLTQADALALVNEHFGDGTELGNTPDSPEEDEEAEE
ncbi:MULTISPECIES: response regulator [Rufibacter]|uniref:CheY-like chemotaxis protein n=1 Tax=Rufibacter quisquiliarum TaxID=1549639 RepID=A0A839GIP9_9BACT|nr:MULTISPECIES: response regulator [Rufibacter]MBA9076629.1 CheY-like chemotaxis protein [Rufibacter quisquiliarum]